MNRSSKIQDINLQIESQQDCINQWSDSMPWMCYLCEPQRGQSIQVPNFSQKEKVNLFKITKHKRKDETISSDTLSQPFLQKPTIINYPQYSPTYNKQQNTRLNTQPSVNDRISFIKPSYQILQPNRAVFPLVSHPKHQDKTIYQVNSLPYNQSVKNTHMSRPSQVAQSPYFNATGTHQIKAVKVSFNKNQQKDVNIPYIKPEDTRKSQIVRPKVIFNANIQNRNTTFKLPQQRSRQILQMRQQNDALEKNNYSVFSTEEQITSPFNFRQTQSIYQKTIASKNSFKQDASFFNQPKQLKFQLNRKKSSSRRSKNPIQTPKLFLNIKKAPSGQSNGDPGQLYMSSQLSDRSNYTHFGNKIKIGIRKAESFASEQFDEYSDVISQGGRSFLMPDIEEQEEIMSRMSSRSGFKNWEEDDHEGVGHNKN